MAVGMLAYNGFYGRTDESCRRSFFTAIIVRLSDQDVFNGQSAAEGVTAQGTSCLFSTLLMYDLQGEEEFP
jgi:hypothetical protein